MHRNYREMNKRYINIVAKSWEEVTAIVLQCASWTDFSCKRSPGGGGGGGELWPVLGHSTPIYLERSLSTPRSRPSAVPSNSTIMGYSSGGGFSSSCDSILYKLPRKARSWMLKGDFLDFLYFFTYVIQQCFICRPSNSTVSEDGGIKPIDCCCFRIDSQTLSNHTARSHPECW